ncbi:Uma2 family endonuclease [Streptomyces phytophilus]|uniref:Uma2 family endonuclease n=1 Tax=Streptomyces phytophilus TaxID=722715 RepID=UPI0015F02A72|nr:Uma2 family endonuclease [Streptomyces phytophilus]
MTATERTGSAEEDPKLAAFLQLKVPKGYRAELIEGEILVTPPPDRDHEDIVGKLTWLIARESATRLYAPGTVGLITPLGRFIPDATVAAWGSIQGAEYWAEPTGVVMTVEVTSVRGDRDRGPKRRGYAAAGIPLYLLVDRSNAYTTLYGDPREGDYRRTVSVPFGKGLDLPAPFSFSLDTAVFV